MLFDGFVMLEEYLIDVWVDRPEIALEVRDESRDAGLGNGQDAPNDISNPIFLAQAKVPSDDPACIRE